MNSTIIVSIISLLSVWTMSCVKTNEFKKSSDVLQDQDKKKTFSLPKFTFKVEPRLIEDRSAPANESLPTNAFGAAIAEMIVTCQKMDSEGRMAYCPFDLNGETQQNGYKAIETRQIERNSFPFEAVKIEYVNDPGIFMCTVIIGFPTRVAAHTVPGGHTGGYYYYDDEERSDRYSWITYCDTSEELPANIIGSPPRFGNRIKALSEFKTTIIEPYPLILVGKELPEN
jgi:hypothetical protein